MQYITYSACIPMTYLVTFQDFIWRRGVGEGTLLLPFESVLPPP